MTKESMDLILTLYKSDFRIDTFKCSGKGGQKVNKTSSGVRITHIETGFSATSCDTRSQIKNKRIAFKKLGEANKFQLWCKIKASEKLGIIKSAEQIEQEVDEQFKEDLQNGNIVIEYLEGE